MEAFDRIEVLFPSSTSVSDAEKFLALLRSVRFRKHIQVRPHFYASRGLGFGTARPRSHADLIEAETAAARDLSASVFSNQLVLKYPNPLVGRDPARVERTLFKWSRAVRQTVPADYDLVHISPRSSDRAELVKTDAYIISRGGATKLVAAPRSHRNLIRAFELDFGDPKATS